MQPEKGNSASFGSYYTTIINQSSNTITKIIVQQILNGSSTTTTYNNPANGLQVPANGEVNITFFFVRSGPSGMLRAYQQCWSCGWTLKDSEDYNPSYPATVQYGAYPDATHSGWYQVIVSNN